MSEHMRHRGLVQDSGILATAEDAVIRSSGDSAILVEFPGGLSLSVAARVQALLNTLESWDTEGLVEAIPGYRTVLIHYDVMCLPIAHLVDKVTAALAEGVSTTVQAPSHPTLIPVCYGGRYGPDLSFVAEVNGLTEEEVVWYHTSVDYYVYFTGFLPGFPFLGDMSACIAAPRRSEPRLQVAAGSVGIAQTQTGVYPVDSPGGWQIIGRTSVKLFDMDKRDPFLLHAGDWVRFQQVSHEEFLAGV